MSVAKAKLVGTIANEIKLTSGGMCIMKILVVRENPTSGKQYKSYIPVFWWREKAAAIVQGLREGDAVEVIADVGMNIREGEYPQVQLAGEKVKKVGPAQPAAPAPSVVENIAAEFDATEMPMPDDSDIPF